MSDDEMTAKLLRDQAGKLMLLATVVECKAYPIAPEEFTRRINRTRHVLQRLAEIKKVYNCKK